MRKNISAKAFETCRVACPHGFCVADDSCSLPISKCTRRRNELRSFRFQVRICTVTSSHIYNFGCREVSLCCCREVRVEDNVRHSVTLKMFFVLSCFGVASRILRSAWLLPKTCTVAMSTAMWVVARSLVWTFPFFVWFSAVYHLGMRACATTRTLRSSHNC